VPQLFDGHAEHIHVEASHATGEGIRGESIISASVKRNVMLAGFIG
jgi:hypothetical protein